MVLEHVIFRLFYILVCTHGPFIVMLNHDDVIPRAEAKVYNFQGHLTRIYIVQNHLNIALLKVF